MRVSDFLIDLNDIYGRVIPGILLIFDIYLIANLFIPINMIEILEYFKESSSLLIPFILIFLVISHIIGELPLYTIFKFRCFSCRKTSLDILKRIDFTTGRDVITYFESKFSTEALNSKDNSLMDYCKNYLLEDSFSAYAEARKIEARINLKGGMIIPMFILTIVCLFYKYWPFVFLPLSLLVVFSFGFYTSYIHEHSFVYKAFYNCCTNLPKLDNKGNESSKS